MREIESVCIYEGMNEWMCVREVEKVFSGTIDGGMCSLYCKK